MKLETLRLTLSGFSSEDAPFILRLLNDTTFIENIRDSQIRTLDQALGYLENLPLLKVSLKSGIPIGMCGLLKREFLPHSDLGFAYLSDYHRQGFAPEAGRAVLKWGFEELEHPEILGICAPQNEPSQKVLTGLSMIYQKKLQIPHEVMVFSTTPSRFQKILA
jgi:[ribosomal protein S5]-alanine N-acetyltransferase